MNPTDPKAENFELPKPSGADVSQDGLSAPEQGASSEQGAVISGSSVGPTTTATPFDPTLAIPGTTPVPVGVSAHTVHLSAEDNDLIEKTWVEKAKQIVAETRGDPYVQNNEINKVKADYIKKRYNKDIKLTSE